MTEDAVADRTAAELSLADGDRLSLGVAARLSRYLQVLIQARKMGKETISSQELAEYTHINSTQIRRDLSGFGKFGKRGVGYRVDSLVEEIRRILRSSGKHNIVLFGAGNLGQAIASVKSVEASNRSRASSMSRCSNEGASAPETGWCRCWLRSSDSYEAALMDVLVQTYVR